MSATVVNRLWQWPVFVWVGVIASIVGWGWAWSRLGGAIGVMLLVAIAAVVFAYRGMAGMRVALGGLVAAGAAMFVASLYLTYQLLILGTPAVSTADVLTTAVFPMVCAVVLLLGAAAGFRHPQPA